MKIFSRVKQTTLAPAVWVGPRNAKQPWPNEKLSVAFCSFSILLFIHFEVAQEGGCFYFVGSKRQNVIPPKKRILLLLLLLLLLLHLLLLLLRLTAAGMMMINFAPPTSHKKLFDKRREKGRLGLFLLLSRGGKKKAIKRSRSPVITAQVSLLNCY